MPLKNQQESKADLTPLFDIIDFNLFDNFLETIEKATELMRDLVRVYH